MRIRQIALGALLLIGSLLADRFLPVSSSVPAGEVPTVPSGGVLSCPMATTGSGEAFLYLFNAGDEDGRARVLIRPVDGTGVRQVRVGIAAGGIETIPLHALIDEPSGVLVEWSGGQIVASHTIKTERRLIGAGRRLPRFVAGAQCQETAGPQLAFAAGRTNDVGDTILSLFNPGPAPADVSISVRVDGQFVQPQRLQRRIVRPLSRRDFSLRDFAFGKGEIAVVVRADSGRVAAEAYVETRSGAEIVTGQPPLAEALALAPVSGKGVRLSLSSTDPNGVTVLASRYADGESDATEVPPSLGPGVPGQITVPAVGDDGPVAYSLLTETAGRLTAAISWSVSGPTGYDLVGASAALPSTVWQGVSAGMNEGWKLELLVAAARGEGGVAELEVHGPRARSEEVDLPPGTVRVVRLANGKGTHGFVLRSDVPVVVILVARAAGDAAGFAFVPSAERPAVATAPRGDSSVGISRR